MKFYKVVNSIKKNVFIDTDKINYSLTLHKQNEYKKLLSFVTKLSSMYDLPLDVFFEINNNLAWHGNFYLQKFPKSKNGIFEIIDFTRVPHHKNMYIKESTLINIVETLDFFGISEFLEGYYLWEFIYESVRVSKHKNKPSRLESFFLFENLNDCNHYITTYKGNGQICEVELLKTDYQFKADMNLLNDIPNYYTSKETEIVAESYWQGKSQLSHFSKFFFRENAS